MALRSDAIQNSTQNPSSMTQTSTAGRGLIRGAGGNSIMVSEGQVLKGVVTDIHGNQITIQMEDGSHFTGQLADASNYNIGQGAAFQVTSTSAGVIYMQAITDAYLLGMEDTINQALEEAELPKSPRNVEIVRSLLSNQQSISRQNILDTIRLCARFPDDNVESVITAKHLSLPMTEESITQLEQYQNQTHQLMGKMDTLTQSVSDVLSLMAEKAPDAAGAIGSRILELALESSDFLEDPASIKTPVAPLAELVDVAGNPIPADTIFPVDEDGIPYLPEQVVMSENGELVPLDSLPLDEDGNPILPVIAQEIPAQEIVFEKNQVGALLTPEAREVLTNEMNQLPLAESVKEAVADGTITNRDLLTQLQELLPKLTSEQASELVSGKEFQALLKSQLISGWSITPKAFAGHDNIEKLYEKLDRQLSTLTKLSQSVSSQNAFQTLGETASNMHDNLQFMKTLNQSFTYMQLPLNLQEQNAHGDLYVMTRKGAMKKNPDKLSVLLHLEMDSLGTLDIHIKKERTNVDTQFFVDDKKTMDLLSKNINLLQDAINEQGYSFSSQCNIRERDIDIVKDFMAQDKPIGDMKRYRFDLRA